MENRYTPENITKLELGEVFVFGSNEFGMHGAGTAAFARENGFPYGKGFGFHKGFFAIPTKDWKVKTLDLPIIQNYVDRFYDFVEYYPKSFIYLVTKIGCGLAGYTVEDIAPMFYKFLKFENVKLPKEFFDFYEKNMDI